MKSSPSDRDTNSQRYSMFYDTDVLTDAKRRCRLKNKFLVSSRHPKRLSIFESWSMIRQGHSDGRLGLPRQNSAGEWSSPQIELELNRLNEITQQIWWQFREATTDLQIEVKKLQLRLEQLKIKFESVSDRSRYHGEENIDSSVVRVRRQMERAGIAETELCLAKMLQEISELKIQALYVCAQARSRTGQHLAAYWLACLQTNPNSDQMPPAPPVLPDIEMNI